MTNQEMLKEIAVWARAQGRKAPKSKEGMKILVAEYLACRLAENEAAAVIEEEEIDPRVDQSSIDRGVHLINDGGSIQITEPLSEGIYEDDWNHLLRERAQAAVGPQGQLLDDFDQEFELRNRAQQDLIDLAPFSRTNPISVLKGSLGGQKIFTVEGQVNEWHQVAFWSGDDAETTPVTVTLANQGRISVPGMAVVNSVSTDARVTFGTKGMSAQVIVDMSRGCQFTVSGSEVRVEIRSNAPVIASASLSFRACTHQQPITRTIQIATGSLSTAVPAFAKSLTIWRLPVANAVTVNFLDNNGSTRYSYLLAASAYNLDPLPIGNEISDISVTDTGGGGISAGSALIFNLAL